MAKVSIAYGQHIFQVFVEDVSLDYGMEEQTLFDVVKIDFDGSEKEGENYQKWIDKILHLRTSCNESLYDFLCKSAIRRITNDINVEE